MCKFRPYTGKKACAYKYAYKYAYKCARFFRVWTKVAHFYYTYAYKCAYKCAFLFDRLWIAITITKYSMAERNTFPKIVSFILYLNIYSHTFLHLVRCKYITVMVHCLNSVN